MTNHLLVPRHDLPGQFHQGIGMPSSLSGLHRVPRSRLELPSKNTVLTHRLLALRRGRDTDFPVPPHRSGEADFPHPALASGGDARTERGIRMADMGRKQPAAKEPLHTLPLDASLLARSFESMVPEVT